MKPAINIVFIYVNYMKDNKKSQGDKEMNVYLVPTENATYQARIWNELPTENAILLIKEGGYPVSIWSNRYDTNMSYTPHFELAYGRDELVYKLNNLGQHGGTIQKLWQYDASKDPDSDVADLFQSCCNFKSRACWQAYPYLCAHR
jgi:hypothetical protein